MNISTVEFYARIAEKDFYIKALYKTTLEFCNGFIISKEQVSDSFFQISTSPEDISKEQQAFDTPVSKERGELFAVHRQITEKLITCDTLLFHGSAVSVDNCGIIFTAPSQTGKSTHAEKWHRLFGAEYINDDKPYIAVKDKAVAFGSPWMGEHNRGSNSHVTLKTICIIERAEENSVTPIPQSDAFYHLMKQTYIPKRADLMRQTFKLVSSLSKMVSLYKIRCNTEDDSALMARKEITVL